VNKIDGPADFPENKGLTKKNIFQVQKLNDANGIGTPGRKLKTKTQKTKNQLKNLLTPRTAKGSKLISR
jgi:hypothetical protein